MRGNLLIFHWSFKTSCLICSSDACDYFATQLSPLNKNEQEEWLDKIVDYIQKQTLHSPFVEKDLVEAAIHVS